jgi:ABC-type iron transport system FetAB ATPase subunit
MRLLSRAIRTASAGGATLPTVWRSLLEQQIAFRRGEVSMIAGPPGAGKSTFALITCSACAGTNPLYLCRYTLSHYEPAFACDVNW